MNWIELAVGCSRIRDFYDNDTTSYSVIQNFCIDWISTVQKWFHNRRSSPWSSPNKNRDLKLMKMSHECVNERRVVILIPQINYTSCPYVRTSVRLCSGLGNCWLISRDFFVWSPPMWMFQNITSLLLRTLMPLAPVSRTQRVTAPMLRTPTPYDVVHCFYIDSSASCILTLELRPMLRKWNDGFLLCMSRSG